MLAEVKQLNIKQVIEEETGLRFNKSNMLEKCPICGKGQKTKSFSVTKDAKIFKCFSCDAKGSIIDFIMQYKKMTNTILNIKNLISRKKSLHFGKKKFMQ